MAVPMTRMRAIYVDVDGVRTKITPSYLTKKLGLKRSQAGDRIRAYLSGRITEQKLLASLRKGGKPRVYQRGDVRMTLKKLLKMLPGLEPGNATRRLLKWERGDWDYEKLIHDGRASEMGDFSSMTVGPRRSVESIRISDFERSLSIELDKDQHRRVIAEEFR